MSDLKTKLLRIGKGAATILVERLVLPWYVENAEQSEDKGLKQTRSEVAHTIHQALAGLVWNLRDSPDFAENHFIVESVEPFQFEDGDYTLSVFVRHKEDVVEAEAIAPLPLHVFLQNFEPCGQIELEDYNS